VVRRCAWSRKPQKMRRPWPALGRSATEKKNYWILKIITVLTRCPYLSLLWARRIHPHLYILFLKITIHFPPIYASVFTGFSFLRKFRLQYYINYSFALLQLYSNWTGINIAWFVVHCCLLYTVVCCTLLFVVHCCLLYTVVCCALLFVVHCCLLYTVVCCTLLYVVHCCLLYTVVCCTLLYVVHCCLLYTVVCCTLLFVVHCCMLYTVVCCTLLFVVHCCMLYTVVCCTLLFVVHCCLLYTVVCCKTTNPSWEFLHFVLL